MSFETPGAPTADSPNAETKTEPNGAEVPEGSIPAESSPADEKDAKPADLLSVVKSAVAPEATSEAVSSAAVGEGEAEAEAVAGKPQGEVSAEAEAEADAKLPFHEHPRWKQVLAERDGFKDDAGRFRQLEGYMQEHGLEAGEVAEGFDVMAKLKSGDPTKLGEVRDWFATRLDTLNKALGHELPDDLRERVENGTLDQEGADELARARAAEALRTAKTQRTEAAEGEAEAQRQVVANAEACATAVDEWEQKQKASDPDYAKKAELVETTCRAIVQRTGKAPTTPEQAVGLVKQAYAEVTQHFKSLSPTPKPIRRAPSGSSAPTVTEPKSLREAIAASLNKG